jgi:hypothetical protein
LPDDIAVFTLHKSASMFIHRQCELLCRMRAIDYHSPNLRGSGLDARALATDRSIWLTRHGCIAPIRFFVNIPNQENYRIILHLRDPRDVLVSMFYSYCYIHPGEIQANTGYRREAAARGIDAFVLDKASGNSRAYPGDYGTGGHVEDLIGDLPRRYRDYIEHFLGRPNVVFVKYEEMVTDYRSWLGKFIEPFGFDDSARVIDALAAQATQFFPSRSTDEMQHVRHVAPGDHRAKLRPATIERLNAIFAPTLQALNYDTSRG